jgi:hypothetical protein
MNYLEEGEKIWKLFVPKSGQADTVQGELLRAVEKLRDEAIRNGNGNWDAGFEILLNYLESKLLDNRVFSEERIAETKRILARLKDFDNPCLEDEPYDDLDDRVVDYYRFYGSQPHEKNPNLRR